MNTFPEYHKIQGVYKRDSKGNFIIGDYSLDVFKQLENTVWRWTEKIDGTNIRIGIDPGVRQVGAAYVLDHEPIIAFGGHHGKSQIHPPLKDYLDHEILQDAARIQATLTNPVILYGEGYGGKIQSGAVTYGYPRDPSFIVFDIFVPDETNPLGGYWLDYDKVVGLSASLGLITVPLANLPSSPCGLATLKQAIVDIRWHGCIGDLGRIRQPAEGIVGTPLVPLFDRRGHRIITKIKARDFDFLRI